MQALKHEIKKIGSLALFFLIGFGYILVVMKLFLKEYSIDTYVLSKAIIGSLVAAKAVAIMDATPLINRFEQSPRYLRILYKTFVYTLAVLILGIIEHLLHAYHQTKAIVPAFKSFIASENFYQFLAVMLCIAIVFLMHNIFKEIDTYFGKGNLSKFFFDTPEFRPKNSRVLKDKD
ncbi:hypothetical protein VB715_01900 [Crocosphaera sp. UHCC 0190]|uniref:hypothetical protein n=1 Tax=Crocosphaera sp. UHCC 0190 TaxID=3110246 RepID=UPI002B202759|nr:hypothetical protein [Crocosphaera sp. UHCC 0190]MEA5508508.1 hypothetical protein [Crocosphaera sp. UHCC 0190]